MDSRRKSKIHVRIIALIIVICLILVGVGFAVYYFVKPSSVSNPAITSSPIIEDKHINIYFIRHGKTDANINNVKDKETKDSVPILRFESFEM